MMEEGRRGSRMDGRDGMDGRGHGMSELGNKTSNLQQHPWKAKPHT
jgi:hypothetical protein